MVLFLIPPALKAQVAENETRLKLFGFYINAGIEQSLWHINRESQCQRCELDAVVRYTPKTFPEDLVFQQTSDRQNFQGRYVLRHPWKGSPTACPAAKGYFESLKRRREKEALSLASLTGWDIDKIRKEMGEDGGPAPEPERWWENLWK